MMFSSKSKFRTAIMLAILGVGLIAIVVTGFGTGGMGGLQGGAGGASSSTLVQVGREGISDSDFSARFESIFRQNARQNPNIDRARFVDGSFGAILEATVADRALVAFARSLGFVVPQAMVDRAIVAIPAFQNVAGQFDEVAFRTALQQANVTERQLREDIEQSQLIKMVAGPVSGGSHLPQVVATEYANLLLERRSGALVPIPVARLTDGINPNDQQIAQFYQQNQRSFALPERRVIKFALIGRDQLGDAVRATDQEIAAYYQQNQAQYGPGETRNIQRIVLPDEAAARAFMQKVQSGTSFQDAAAQAGFAASDINFPQQTREQFTTASNPEVANAAFTAQQGALAGPFRTDLGFQVVRVDAINRTPARSLESVRGEIAAAIEQRKLADALNAAIERIQDRIDDGASIEEVAQAEHLSLQTTPAVAANGAGQNFQMPQELAPLVQQAFDLTPEDDAVLAPLQPDGRYALLAVANVIPSAPPPLAEIRDEVRRRLIQHLALQRGKSIADGIASRINGGTALAQAIAQAGVALPAPTPVAAQRYEIAQQGQQVAAPLALLFAIPQGRARVIPAPNGTGWVVVFHQQRTAGNVQQNPNGRQILAAARRGIEETAEDELRLEFARAVENAVGVTRNEEAINALRQRLRGGAQ